MCGAILTVSSKVFDYVNHFLLIAKLAAYDFSYESLNFIKVIWQKKGLGLFLFQTRNAIRY